MFSEKIFEDIICKYPELIEEGLIFKGRQISLYGKRIDILFEDKHNEKLIIELKIGPIQRKHIGQVMDYEGDVLSEEEPTARVMLVGNRVPPNLKKVLNHHGIEWKEIPLSQLRNFLKHKEDKDFSSIIIEEDAPLKQALFKKENKLPIANTNKNTVNISANIRSKIGILFCMKYQNARDGVNHLKNHEELYFSFGRQIKSEKFVYPLIGLIHINEEKRIGYKCSIKKIRPYKKSDHSDPNKKPQNWIDDPMNIKFKTTIIIDAMTRFEYDTKKLTNIKNNKITSPRGYQGIFLPDELSE